MLAPAETVRNGAVNKITNSRVLSSTGNVDEKRDRAVRGSAGMSLLVCLLGWFVWG